VGVDDAICDSPALEGRDRAYRRASFIASVIATVSTLTRATRAMRSTTFSL